MPGPLYLLGPQRPSPNMPTVIGEMGGSGRIVYITAGWRHEETDDEALQRDIGPPGHLLPIYAWFEELARAAPELFQAYHEQQKEIRKLKSLYRLRLDPALESVRALLAQRDAHPNSEFVTWEIEDAIATLRGLRDRFVKQCDAIRARFEEQWKPKENPRIAQRRDFILRAFTDARAVLIAGGHVGVLRNRLEFFGVGEMLSQARESGTAIVAWSAGAMAIAERVVLFHDDPPMGQHNAEVLDRGLGLAEDIIVLPHARQRLSLDDRSRVAILASRFAPTPCVGLENGAWLERRDGRWINRGNRESAFQLNTDGSVTLLGGADA